MIQIQNKVGIPKYKQIIISIEKAIEDGDFKKNAKLPSINKVCLTFSLSRDTVMQAYDVLKKRGIIYSILGKGYYVKSVETSIKQKIFLLFDELNIFKEDIYNSFLQQLGENVQVDIFFHHFNSDVFRKLIADANGNYTKYVIMPTNITVAASIIKTLPANEVYILDQTNPDLLQYPAIYQNFVKDIYDALLKGKSKLKKYNNLVILFPGFREPLGMKIGFEKFCKNHRFNFEIVTEFGNRTITAGEVYVIPNDRDLVRVIEKSKTQNLQLGTDFGIISYNDTPLKKIVEGGITTISTDFEAMGRILASIIISGKQVQIENKCRLIVRKSL